MRWIVGIVVAADAQFRLQNDCKNAAVLSNHCGTEAVSQQEKAFVTKGRRVSSLF
jgi:hypothetical protein